MVRTWWREVGRIEGDGTINPGTPGEGRASYTLIIERNMRKRAAVGQPTEIVAGSTRLVGYLNSVENVRAIPPGAEFPLRLEDGREIKVMVPSFPIRRFPAPMTVMSVPRDFLPQE